MLLLDGVTEVDLAAHDLGNGHISMSSAFDVSQFLSFNLSSALDVFHSLLFNLSSALDVFQFLLFDMSSS